MNWGNKLLLVFVVFGGGISYMVFRCMQTPVDLVSKDYYRDELSYQQVIDGASKANALSEDIRIGNTPTGIRLELPAEMKHRSVTGSIRFYCAADAGRDREITLDPDGEGGQDIPRSALIPGRYTVSISWRSAGVGYFSQQPYVIH
ncbi:MAG TPA: FixH family protein [Puia sp.]|nr:FixH family protein [Puia sp.]